MENKFLLVKFLLLNLCSLTLFSIAFANPSFAQAVEITSFGHSSLLVKGGGKKILLNPFNAIGCAQGLREPKVNADIILASSELSDEGARLAKGIFFVEPGSYKIDNLRLEGLLVPHDRLGGRRYGMSTVWIWEQAGFKFVHLGGSAAPLSVEDKLIIGRPDILVIGVGGGAKVYNGKEAAEIVKDLSPKIVIPVQYVRNSASPPKECDQSDVQPFLESLKEIPSKRVGSSYKITNKFSKTMTINIMD